MQQLLDHVKEIRREKITALKNQLEEQEQLALADLQSEVAHLRLEVDRLGESTAQQAKSKQQYQQETAVRFVTERYKLQLLEELWQDVADKYFAKTEHLKNWLAQQLEGLDVSAGEIFVGPSYNFLLQALKKNKKHSENKNLKVKKDDHIKQAGFIYQGADKIIDARLSVYLEETFQNHKSELYASAFLKQK